MYEELNERRRNKKREIRTREKTQNYPIVKGNKNKDVEKVDNIDYTMDGSVKQLFLNLTKMQIPFNYEKTLVEFFPNMEIDGHGNYYKKVGTSKTMFCGHLDTYCREYKRVWHVIDGDIIKTDGTTTLGGDDKAGIVVMIKMMEANIPGLYYFFRGEEGVTSPSGTWGSKQALKSRGDFFKDYDKCVAFDRKANTSIISEQMYSECCSSEFVNALISEFKKNGMDYRNDPTGMWCDSGVFMETIPECTNISMGYKAEHTFNEEQDIVHLEKLVNAAINIDWEKLPVKRDPTLVSKSIGRFSYEQDWDVWDRGYSNAKRNTVYKQHYTNKKKSEYDTMEELFVLVQELLTDMNYECLNPDDFKETVEIYFSNVDYDDFFGLRIIDFDIYLSDDDTLKKYTNIGDFDNFKKHLMTGINPNDIESDNTQNTMSEEELIKKISEVKYQLDQTYDEEDSNDLAKQLNILEKQLDKINKNKSVKKEISKSEFNYTEEQQKAFKDLSSYDLDLLKSVMDDMKTNNTKTLKSELWLKIDHGFKKLGYKVNYGVHGTEINPDEYTEWIYDYWTNMESLLKYGSDSKNKIKINSGSGFLGTLEDFQINTSRFHQDQYQLFGKLVDNEPELVKLIFKDFEINDAPKVRPSLTKMILDELSSIDYKRSDKTIFKSYPDKFVNFCSEFEHEIKKYYEKH